MQLVKLSVGASQLWADAFGKILHGGMLGFFLLKEEFLEDLMMETKIRVCALKFMI